MAMKRENLKQNLGPYALLVFLLPKVMEKPVTTLTVN